MGRRLRALEAATGHTLFQRTANGFVLTEAGQGVMRTAEHMEDEAQAFERRLVGGDQQLEGMLRLSSSDWFGTPSAHPGDRGLPQRFTQALWSNW